MKRREFITLLGGAAAWPLGVRAQQPDQVAIGMLIGYPEDDPETQARLAAFREGLGQLGWIEGRNVRIDYRFAPAGLAQAQLFAKELITLRPNVLVGHSTPASFALSRETRKIPIVFVGLSDPVGGGLVASTGNATGVHQFRAVHNGEVARIAQGDRARHGARRSHVQSQEWREIFAWSVRVSSSLIRRRTHRSTH
jgi:putative tryptophan/tyrosine transport system substrate-binding protein